MDIVGYLKSVLEDARPYARMKLMIVGVQGIGKTSLLEQLRQEGITRRKSEVCLALCVLRVGVAPNRHGIVVLIVIHVSKSYWESQLYVSLWKTKLSLRRYYNQN